MLLAACQSTKIVYEHETVVPELSFPKLPIAENMVNNNDGTVTVPAEWLVQLAEFQIRYEETQKNYEELKAIYEK